MTRDKVLFDSQAERYVHPALKTYFGYCLHKAAMKLRADLNDALVDHQIIASQLGILCLLSNSGPMSQVEIGSIMIIDKATIVKLLDGLEELGWIKRAGSSDDRRINNICITKSGEQVFEKMQKLRLEVEKKFFSVLTAEEEKQLRKLIPKLI